MKEKARDAAGLIIAALLMVASTMLVVEGSKDVGPAPRDRDRVLEPLAVAEQQPVGARPGEVTVAPAQVPAPPSDADATAPNSTRRSGTTTSVPTAVPPPATAASSPPAPPAQAAPSTALPSTSVVPADVPPTTTTAPIAPTTTVPPEAPTTTVPCLIHIPLLGLPLLCLP